MALLLKWLGRSPGQWRALLKRLHRDERGVEAVEWVLIIAAIAIPLMGLLWYFAGEIKDWVWGIWEDARGEVDDSRDSFFNPGS